MATPTEVDKPVTGPITIVLYLAVPRLDQAEEARNRYGFRRVAAQALDICSAFVSRKPKFRFHRWHRETSNKGDIAIREQIRRRLEQLFVPDELKFLEFKWGTLDTAAIEKINSCADLFVIAGGGYFFPSFGDLPKRVLDDAVVFEHIVCPKMAYSLGWNILAGEDAVLNKASAAAIKRITDQLKLISARGPLSQACIQEHTSKNVALTADPVLFLRTEKSPKKRNRGSGRRRMGVNIAFHGPVSALNFQRDIEKFVRLLKKARKNLNLELCFISHTASDRLVWWLLLARGVRMKWCSSDIDQMSDFYSTLDIHLGQMMHSSIFAMGAEVPAVAISYDRKVRGFFELMNFPDYVLDIQDWEEEKVYQLVERALTEGMAIRAQIRSRKAELAQNERAFLENVKKEVLGHRASG